MRHASSIAATRQALKPDRARGGRGVGALQQVDRRCGRQLLREERERAAGEQLHLDAIELRPGGLDLRRVLLPLGGAGVEDQAARRRWRKGRGRLGDLEGLGQGFGGQRDGRASRWAHEYRVLFQQRDRLARVLRQQVAVGIHDVGLDAAGAQLRQPFVHQRARHHRDGYPAGLRGALADGEVQIVDVVGEVLLERVGHQLLQLGAGFPDGTSGSASSTSAPGTSTHIRRPAVRGAASDRGPLCGGPVGVPRASTTSQVAGCSGARGRRSSSQSAMAGYCHDSRAVFIDCVTLGAPGFSRA